MKNCNAVAALLFSALAAAAPLQQRAYDHRNTVVVVTATATTTHWLEFGEAPPAATPAGNAQEVPEAQASKVTSSAAVAPVSSAVVEEKVPAASSTVVSSTVVAAPVTPTSAPVEPVVTSSAAAVPVSSAPASSAAAAPSSGAGTGGANPFFPNGPAVGESHQGIRLSPVYLYATQPGAQVLNHHVGACGNLPYDQNDPVLSMTDASGDNKFMLNPPNGDILSYCGAIVKITGPDGRTSTGTVTDSCAACGGPGGIDMMNAGWAEIGDPTDSPVNNASWEITGWATIAAAA